VKLKIISQQHKKYFFIIPKKFARLAVVRNTLKRHVRHITQQYNAKIVFRLDTVVTKKNLAEMVEKIKKLPAKIS
jgi:ribonuclease P protein component